MLDAVVAFLWSTDMGGQTFVDKPVSAQRAASFIDLIYATQDGHISVAIMSNSEWHALATAVGRLRQARPAARFDVTPPGIRHGAPLLGQHSDEILGEIGIGRDDIAALRADGVIEG